MLPLIRMKGRKSKPVRRGRCCVTFLLVNALLALVTAQETVPLPQSLHQWGSISVFNGLPSDGVRAITQTPDGYLWFGTDNGIARYDGSRIQNFSLGDAEADHVQDL